MTRPDSAADCILALDQGTTSSRAILFDRRGGILARAQQEFPQHVKAGDAAADQGIVEHDPEDIWRSQLDCGRRAIEQGGRDAGRVAALGIANQRETTILWERGPGGPRGSATLVIQRTVGEGPPGAPAPPAIVWQSRVSAPHCARLRSQGVEEDVRRRTGLLLDPYFSATKIMHLLETLPGLRSRCEAGEVLFGTVDSFLIWRLTGGRVHATDVTNASRTLLFDIHEAAWSDDLCRIFGVPRAILPEVRPSSGSFGVTDAAIFGGAIPIAGCAGDQQAAAFGQGCMRPGDAKTTYGTGAFLLFATGRDAVASRSGLLTTPACRGPDGAADFFLEGSVFVAGSLIGWLRDGLGLFASVQEVEPLARSVPDSGGVVLVPALAGLGAPVWDPRARGLIIGLTRATTRGHIARAALEAIALSVAEVVGCMEQDSGVRPARMRVDGGASGNDLLMQLQADVLGLPVERPAVIESTSLGAALLAGLAVGFFPDAAAIAEPRRVERVFAPTLDAAERSRLLTRWREAVARSAQWAP